MDWIKYIMDESGFVPRRVCGAWTNEEIFLQNISDLFIFLSYMAIPIMLVCFIWRKKNVPHPWLFWMFGMFIVTCGFTHLMEIILFYHPIYRAAGWVKVVCAIASVSTAISMLWMFPKLLRLAPADKIDEKVAERTHELEEDSRKKDEFLSLIGHEIRNPVAAIYQANELFKLMENEDETTRKEAQEVVRRTFDDQIPHLLRLLDELLDASRLFRGQMTIEKTTINFVEVARQAIQGASLKIKENGHELTVESPDQPVYLEGDATRLMQACANLLTNAARYTPPGGHIKVLVKEINEEVLFSVQDNGIGILPENIESIFESCRRTERAEKWVHGGLGIGLTLANTIVADHGGTIKVASEGKNKGSTFTMYLPIGSITDETQRLENTPD